MNIIKIISTFLFLFCAIVINAQSKKMPNYFGEDTFMSLSDKHEFNKVFYVSSHDIIVVQQIYVNISGKDQRVIHFGIDKNKNGILEIEEATTTEYADLNYSNTLQETLYLGSIDNERYLQDFFLIHQSYDDSNFTHFSVIENNGYDSNGNGELSKEEIFEDRQYEYFERNGFTGWDS